MEAERVLQDLPQDRLREVLADQYDAVLEMVRVEGEGEGGGEEGGEKKAGRRRQKLPWCRRLNARESKTMMTATTTTTTTTPKRHAGAIGKDSRPTRI